MGIHFNHKSKAGDRKMEKQLKLKQKAEARKRCVGEFCWQQDSDEVVHENDYDKIESTFIDRIKYIDTILVSKLFIKNEKFPDDKP